MPAKCLIFATGLLAGGLLGGCATGSAPIDSATVAPPLFAENARVLFQGDSITDGGRGRNQDLNHVFGQDYAYLIAAREGAAHPERHWLFLNRGVSGNRVGDLAKRWQSDTLDLKPDVVSILIGVNDVDLSLVRGEPVPVGDYEKGYDELLAATRAANPNVKFVLGEPFFLPGRHNATNYAAWAAVMPQMRAVVERLAAKYHAPVVHFQKIFDTATQRAPAEYWIWDGIHPTAAGHQLMADEWARVYREFYLNAKTSK